MVVRPCPSIFSLQVMKLQIVCKCFSETRELPQLFFRDGVVCVALNKEQDGQFIVWKFVIFNFLILLLLMFNLSFTGFATRNVVKRKHGVKVIFQRSYAQGTSSVEVSVIMTFGHGVKRERMGRVTQSSFSYQAK